MLSTKTNAITSLCLLSSLLGAGYLHKQTSILNNDSSVLKVAYIAIKQVIPYIRLDKDFTSYENSNQVQFSFLPERHTHTVSSVYLKNYQTQITYRYYPSVSYPAGNYQFSFSPTDTTTYQESTVSGVYTEEGNHLVRYKLRLSPREESYSVAQETLTSKALDKFDFEEDKYSGGGQVNTAHYMDSERQATKPEKFLSGKIFINTVPKGATIEMLSPEGVQFKQGMTLDQPMFKVKVSAKNHIFSIKTFRVAKGKNIFVVPLYRPN